MLAQRLLKVILITLLPFPLLQGVPLRIELGPKDMDKGVVMMARRDTGAKEVVAWADVAARTPQLLETIQVGGRVV